MVMGPVNYYPILLSERAPYIKKKESNCKTKKIKIWTGAPHQDELAA
jgi:hypothetical protein